MQPGSDAAAFSLLTGGAVKFRGEHEHGICVRNGFYLLERRPLILCQNFLEIINRLIELFCR